MYASNVDASSFISHQYIIAGQASSAVNYPSSYGDAKAVPATISPHLARTASTAATSRCAGTTVRWARKWMARAFVGLLCFIDLWRRRHLECLPEHRADLQRPRLEERRYFAADQLLQRRFDGKLRDLSWITPTCANSDHAGCGAKTGPSWVASLVNAIGGSQYWNNTAIFIFWDDYGGWYDPEPPAKLDYDGLGMRIPMLVVSAYAKKGHVSHTHYEHGSILKFVEETFGLAGVGRQRYARDGARRRLRLQQAAEKVRDRSLGIRHRLLHAATAGPSRPRPRLTREARGADFPLEGPGRLRRHWADRRTRCRFGSFRLPFRS